MEFEGSEDEVVREFDVCLAKSLCDKLHVLQYPVCKQNRTYSHDQRLVARVKPKHKKLEVEVLLDTSSPNYDQSKGEQIAINVDGSSTASIAEGSTYDSSVMDTQVLSSSCIPHKGKRFAVACLSNSQVHLTPVAEIMQMRPNFKYMDKAENRAAHAAHLKSMAESGNSSQDEADDAKAVNVRFKGAETEAARTARERSYASYEKSLFEEKWIAASIHPVDDKYSQKELHQLISSAAGGLYLDENDGASCHEMCQSSVEYLQNIVPHYVACEVDSDVCPANVLSLSKVRTMALPEQLKALMKSVKIIYFSHLMTLLPGSPDPNSVVRSLQSYAVLVQSCWVVKSEILYPAKTLTPISGMPAETVCRARDFILCLFSNSDFLERGTVTKMVKLPSDEVKAILDDIAVMKAGLGWHLRLPPDYSFKMQYPDVYERQAMLWSARFKQLSDQLNISSSFEFPCKPTSSRSDKKPPEKPSSGKAKRTVRSPKGSSRVKRSQSECDESTSTAPKQGALSVNEYMNGIPETGGNLDVAAEQAVSEVVDMVHSDRVSESFKALTKSVADGFLSDPIVEAMDVIPGEVHPNQPHTGDDFSVSSDVHMPFVKPASVGVETFAAECPSNICEAAQYPLLNNLQGLSTVNMASINSTVELVANQVRLQTSRMAAQVTEQSDYQNDNSLHQPR